MLNGSFLHNIYSFTPSGNLLNTYTLNSFVTNPSTPGQVTDTLDGRVPFIDKIVLVLAVLKNSTPIIACIFSNILQNLIKIFSQKICLV